MPHRPLSNHIALITGAARGMGYSAVLLEVTITLIVIYLAFDTSSSIIENLGLRTIEVFGEYRGVRLPPNDVEYARAFSSVLQIAAALYVLVRGLDTGIFSFISVCA